MPKRQLSCGGGSAAAYAKSAVLNAAYGRNPRGYTLFARINLGN